MFVAKRPFVPLFALVLMAGCSQPAAQKPNANDQIRKDMAQGDQKVGAKVIYGEDNRRDLFEVTDSALLKLADSTVALMKRSDLSAPDDHGIVTIKGENFGQAFNLCSDEPYRDQDTAAFCSGFLVAPDTIVTAGHCVQEARDCAATSFVFGYAYQAEGAHPRAVAATEVYNCKTVVHSQAENSGADFAVIKLDRAVEGHEPLKLRQSGAVLAGDDVTVIGYPSGLPVKVADGGKVRSLSRGYFVTNLDTYGGNSGSAVFSSRTHEVEGILVRGERDFVYKPGGCSASNRCPETGCRGEDVTSITEVTKYLGERRPRPRPRFWPRR